MSWQRYLKSAENMLLSRRIPSSSDIITLIKKVNPTRLNLSEPEKELGYDLKGRLQNLLLENYGASFHLTPHPYDPDIILIKHHLLPTIDACHADLRRLSVEALETVAPALADIREKAPVKQAKPGKSGNRAPLNSSSPKDALRMAEQLLEGYEYEKAEAELAGIRVKESKEIPVLVKACRMLVDEMGAYDSAINTLLSQPAPVVQEQTVREILALSYYHNGMLLEARTIFEQFAAPDLGKDALHAYADLSFKEGNLLLAWQLLNAADQKPGFVTALTGLRKEIEERLLAEAEPAFRNALAAFEADRHGEAAALAREALEYYPHHQKARALLLRIDELTTAAETAELWERFERSEQSDRRLELLVKLSELDKDGKEKIRNLIAAEKKAQKIKFVESRLDMLPSCFEQGDWSACFDIVQEVSRLEENEELWRRVLCVSPWFAPLYQNVRLNRLPEQKAKELWLTFVDVKQAMLAGRYDGCLERLAGIKEYFRSYPQFKEDYRSLRAFEREKAWDKAGTLLAAMREPGCSPAESLGLAAALRGPLSVLPAEERAQCERELEELLRQREPQPTEDPLWEEYRKALLTGNESKTAALKDRFDDRQARERIEQEVREKFAIVRQPIVLSVTDDLPVDLCGGPSPLTWIGATERYVFMSESDQSVVFVDLAEMRGARLTSPNFVGLWLLDSIPESGIFLFIERPKAERLWRLVITETECRFTAVIRLGFDFCLQADGRIQAVYLCGENSSEYYAAIGSLDQKKTARMVKQNLNCQFHPTRTLKIKEKFHGTYRLSSGPDMFLIGTRGTAVLDENLKILGGSAVTPHIYGVDRVENTIYTVHEGRLCKCGPQLELLKDFTESHSANIFNFRNVFSICKGAETVMGRIGDVVTLYSLQTDKFAAGIHHGNMLFGKVCDRWFYYRYDQSTSTLQLKDITPDLDTLFEWELMFGHGLDGESMHNNWCRITGDDPLDEKAKEIWMKYSEILPKSEETEESDPESQEYPSD